MHFIPQPHYANNILHSLFFFGHFTAVTGPYAGEHKTNLAVSTEFNAM